MKESIKNQLDQLLSFNSKEEELDLQADLLAMQFLSIVDEVMKEENISKKELAKEIGTSASYITQLFRGDRKPNFQLLAKIQNALGIQFKVGINPTKPSYKNKNEPDLAALNEKKEKY